MHLAFTFQLSLKPSGEEDRAFYLAGNPGAGRWCGQLIRPGARGVEGPDNWPRGPDLAPDRSPAGCCDCRLLLPSVSFCWQQNAAQAHLFCAQQVDHVSKHTQGHLIRPK